MVVFTAHMFVFYFAITSAITPPVATAAFVAASITKEDPIATALAAVKIGIVMLVIPFVFALYPELPLIEHAFLDPSSGGLEKVYLPGYDGTVDWGPLSFLLVRLALGLYLLASALARLQTHRMPAWEWVVRIATAVLLMSRDPFLYGTAAATGIAVIAWHRFSHERRVVPLQDGVASKSHGTSV